MVKEKNNNKNNLVSKLSNAIKVSSIVLIVVLGTGLNYQTIQAIKTENTYIEEVQKIEKTFDKEINVIYVNCVTNHDSSRNTDWWNYPQEICLFKNPDESNLLLPVSKKYKLPEEFVPSDLVTSEAEGIRFLKPLLVRQIILDPLKKLGKAAKSDGIDLSVTSAYRSYPNQDNTYEYWVDYNGNSPERADMISARPGHSEHQLGTTVDFSSSETRDRIGDIFHNTRAAHWLADNAWKYGFVLSYPEGAEETTGYKYESWHYRYIGIENAREWHESGMVLSEWLEEHSWLVKSTAIEN